MKIRFIASICLSIILLASFVSPASAQSIISNGVEFSTYVPSSSNHYTVNQSIQVRGEGSGPVFTAAGHRVYFYVYDKSDAVSEYYGMQITSGTSTIYSKSVNPGGSWVWGAKSWQSPPLYIPYDKQIKIYMKTSGAAISGPWCAIWYGGSIARQADKSAEWSVEFTITYNVLPPRDVKASCGDFQDYIRIDWAYDYGQNDTTVFKVYRDGSHIGTVPSTNKFYLDKDANLVPGRLYKYEITTTRGGFGEGSKSLAVYGFLAPNGSLTGNIETSTGNGIENVLVRARPETQLLDNALQFNGTSDHVTIPFRSDLNPRNQVTLEAWVKPEADMQTWARIFGVGQNALELIAMEENTPHFAFYPKINGAWGNVNDDQEWTAGQWYHVAGTYDGSTVRLYINGSLKNSKNVSPGAQLDAFTSNLFIGWRTANDAEHFKGNIDEVRLWKIARTEDQIRQDMHCILNGKDPDLVAYWRFNADEPAGVTGDYSTGGAHHASLSGTTRYSADLPVLAYHGYSSSTSGFFTISDIYYGSGMKFVVTPDTSGKRMFDPVSDKSEPLTISNKTYQFQNPFQDKSSYAIIGRVLAGACGVDGVTIYVGPAPSASTYNGYFSANAQAGKYVIKPEYLGHRFTPASIETTVTEPIEDLVFYDITKFNLRGQVLGSSCGWFIGEATLQIRGPDGCFTTEVTTQNGQYEAELPALPNFTVEVTNLDHPDWILIKSGEKGRFVSTKQISLAEGDTSLNFTYYAPPELIISGLPEAGTCGKIILKQNEWQTMSIQVMEKYGDLTCPADSGTVSIANDLALDKTAYDTTFTTPIDLDYTFRIGGPNLDPGGAHPHQKLMQITAHTRGGVTKPFDMWAIITGHRPRQQTFVTVSPEIPLIILRDPPGDQSYSYIEQQTSTSYAIRLSSSIDASVNQWAEFKTGVELAGGLVPLPVTRVWGTVGSSLEIGGSWLSEVEQQISITSTKRFKTAGSDGVIGDRGDVFIGAALSLLYAITDVLEVDEACNVEISQSIVYGTDSISVHYMYTENHIREVVIPKLHRLKRFTSDLDSIAFYDDQINIWQQTLQLNQDLKKQAIDIGTFQFNGGGAEQSYERSVEISKQVHLEFNLYINHEVATEAGVEIGGSGLSGGVQIRTRLNFGSAFTAGASFTNTVGFSVQDDDEGDSFQFKLKGDPVYGTHVFEVEGGESSCPWESWKNKTAPRDWVFLTMDTYEQSGIDPNAEAVFKLNIQNASFSGEKRSYMLYDLPENNPDGAVLKVNGFAIKDLFPYTIDADASRQATLTVERGPSAFDYQNLKIGVRPVCDAEQLIADTVSFSVHFSNPCSPVVLFRPEENWYVNTAAHDSLQIIIQDYDKSNLNLISMEYSPSHLSSWKSAFTVSSADLPDNNYIHYWNTSGIEDGQHHIRLAVDCNEGIGYSGTKTGVIDRNPPVVFGKPAPADGILKADGVISVTFNEAIDHEALTSENFHLLRLHDGSNIPVDWVYNDGALVILPKLSLNELENEILQLTLTGIQDLYGNKISDGITWSFRVNSNPVYWENGLISKSVYLNHRDTLAAKLINSGNTEANFSITRHPSFLVPEITSGSLPAGTSRMISFILNTTGLHLGVHNDTIFAQTTGGTELLIFELNMQAEPPEWQVDPGQYLHTMTVTAGIYLNNAQFSDEGDIVAAFVNNELRGSSRVQKIFPQNEYAVFLMVHSNQVRDEPVTFKIWDASEGRERPINETLTFISDTTYGSAPELYQLHVGDILIYSIIMADQWNWFSFGLEAKDMSTKTILSRIKAADGDLIKSQTGYSQYLPGTGWIGNLDTMNIGASFKINLQYSGTLDFIGAPVVPVERPISIYSGWNWIAYLPDRPLSLSEALVNYQASDGDQLKNKTTYASYNGSEWVGTLTGMIPGEGYMLKSGAIGELVYPGANGKQIKLSGILAARDFSVGAPAAWTVNPHDFEKSMNITGTLSIDGVLNFSKNTLLAAFVNGECRGIGIPVFVLNQWIFFMTIYGETEEELISFQTWDGSTGEVMDIAQILAFKADMVIGSPRRPFSWKTGVPTHISDSFEEIPHEFALEPNYPNPFNPVTTIRYALKQPEHTQLILYDALGQVVKVLVNERQKAGWYTVDFDASNYASGTYFYKLRAGTFDKIRKMTLIK